MKAGDRFTASVLRGTSRRFRRIGPSDEHRRSRTKMRLPRARVVPVQLTEADALDRSVGRLSGIPALGRYVANSRSLQHGVNPFRVFFAFLCQELLRLGMNDILGDSLSIKVLQFRRSKVFLSLEEDFLSIIEIRQDLTRGITKGLQKSRHRKFPSSVDPDVQ